MITITDQNLTDPTATPPAALLFAAGYRMMQAELEVAVYSGSETVVITWGDALAALAGPPPPAQPLAAIDIPGLFEGVVNDLYSSRIYASWTTERGGALKLRIVFEEEGTELRGGLFDVDFDHLHLDVFLLPSLDDNNTVRWDVQLGFETDGGVLSDSLRGRIEEELLTGDIVAVIVDGLRPFTSQLNQLLGLPEGLIASFDVDNGVATFDDRPAGDRLIDVVFDAVEVHDDTDGAGQGELRFIATVAGIDTPLSEPVSAGSDTVVPLEGSQWRTSLTLPENTSVSARFEAFDVDGDSLERLGGVNLDLDPDDAPLALQVTEPGDHYTLLARVVERGDVERPPHMRHLRVSVPSVQVLSDLDGVGKGEVQFWALAANQPTAVSAETKVKGGDDPEIELGGALRVELYLPEGEDLEVRVVGWDNDPSQRDWLGEARLVMPGAAIGVGDGPERVFADTGDYWASILIEDLDEPPPDVETPPDDAGEEVETVRRLVVFDSLTIAGDQDTIGAGDILVTGTITATPNTAGIGDGEPIHTAHGTELALAGADWSAEIDVPVTGTLRLDAGVTDVDGRVDDSKQHNDDLLGNAALVFDATDDWGLGSHAMGDADGDFVIRLRILDPDAETGELEATVRFDEIEILHDHTTFGRGEFWSIASVNGFPVGTDERFEAGRGDLIVLDSDDWSRDVALSADQPIEIAFEVVEAGDNDHVSLGTVTAHLSHPWPAGTQEVTSDEGDFILRYRVIDSAQSGANRLRVTFLEVTALDDGDPLSEGELRFTAEANDEESGLSEMRKARADEPLLLVGDTWTLEPQVDAGDDLVVTFTAYDDDGHADDGDGNADDGDDALDDDADSLKLIDRIEDRYSLADAWGLGEHVVTSPDERFRLRYAIAGADEEALPDVPDRVPLLVEFTAVRVHDDGDNLSRGQISFTGTANGMTVLQTGEYDVDSGETVLLGDPLGPRTVWLTPDEDLEITLTASERDGGNADILGTSRHVHRAADGWELGEQEILAPGGAITATWRVDRADGPRMRVKFLHVHVFDDEEPVGPGELVCKGTVDGVSTGPSLPLKAGSDGRSDKDDIKSDIYIGGPHWTKTVSYDPEDPRVDIAFTVTERDTASRDDLLGTVRVDAGGVVDTLGGIDIITATADTERFVLTFVAQRLG
jgi:hypothetical protein